MFLIIQLYYYIGNFMIKFNLPYLLIFQPTIITARLIEVSYLPNLLVNLVIIIDILLSFKISFNKHRL